MNAEQMLASWEAEVEHPWTYAKLQRDGTWVIVDNRHNAIRWRLSQRHVSPEIIERVIRLNPDPREGERIRGLHRKCDERHELFWNTGAVQRCVFIHRFGREAFDALPREAIVKRGRRVYVRWDWQRRR